ncbi:MAG: hypothetical protein AAFP16_00875 [Pseudomonadota bacterium]
MDRYSRLVAWLKVLLPLTALALLSTLFLLSRKIDPIAAIPFADTEIKERVSGQQITGPFFSGTTSDGDRITLTAGTMRTGASLASEVDKMSAQIDLVSGTRVTLAADEGQFDMSEAYSTLTGSVIIRTSTGYEMTTNALTADLDALRVESDGAVAGNGPIGRLDAGQMRIEKREPGRTTHLVFTKGVKLVYDPQNLEE